MTNGVGDPGGAGAEPAPIGVFESFLPRARRAAVAAGAELPSRVEGSALFADISGFTALAEALVAEHGRQRGAEELDANLNRVYQAIIDDLAAHHGEVLYFSGDAITCWLDGDDGSRAVQCALDMQATMAQIGGVETIRGSITLSIKVAVAVGRARRFPVGDPDLQRIDVLAGRLIDDLAAAESLAEQGDVIADTSVVEGLGARLVWSEERTDPEVGRRCAVVAELRQPPARQEPLPLAALAMERVRPWLIPEVFERLAVGGGAFLGELRSAYPIFIRFGGFDFDDDPEVEQRVDEFVRAAQHALHRYGGTLLGLTTGDKGAYINAVVGALRSHEDDALRAVSAALEVRDLEHHTSATGLQVGVAHGPIYAGTYGHPDRHTYSVLGDPTNTAARLMVKAPPGEVYVLDRVAATVEDRFVWSERQEFELKGKVAPVGVRAAVVARRRAAQRVTRYELPMVGRDRELARASASLEAVRNGEQRFLAVSAEAGMGKSRFVAELLGRADAARVPVLYGQAESLGQGTSYLVWREVWRRLFGLDDERPDIEQADHLVRVLRSIDPLLAPRAPLLSGVVGVTIPDNDFVSAFDAKLRKTSLESLLGDVLVDRLAADPVVVVLEDVQWMDPPSADLLAELARRTAGLPALFLLSYRREPGAEVPVGFDELPELDEIVLDTLDRTGMEEVVAAKAAQVFGVGVGLSPELTDLVLDRAQGNPFYAEELVNYLQRLAIDPSQSATSIELPDNLNSIVLSRIDALEERPRQAVKVASVAGRTFRAPMLGRVHEPLGDEGEVIANLDVARSVDLVVPENEELVEWLFRHAITAEVAYESLPFSVRRTFHERLGDELAADDSSAAWAGEIAHHYWHSDNVEQKRRWLRLAGDAARAAYANEAAIEQYSRLAQVAPEADRAQVLLDLAAVVELVGEWDTARRWATEARTLAGERGEAATVGWCDVALAEIERKQGRYDEAVALLGQASAVFGQAGDEAGLARVLHLRGTVAAQQGDLTEARTHYEASRSIRERLDDRAGLAGLLSNLGVVAEYEEDYEASRRHHEQALELRRQIDDRWAIGVSYTNLGMIAVHEGRHGDARELFEESMRLSAEVGDSWMVAIAHNNLGNANRGLGLRTEAMAHYAAALATSRSYGDFWALAFLVEDIALLAIDNDDIEIALRLLGVADRWRSRLDAPRPASTERQVADGLVARSVDEGYRSSQQQIGAAWSDQDAIDHAASYCDSPPDPAPDRHST